MEVTNQVKNQAKNQVKNQAKKLFILLTEGYLDKTSLTTFTVVAIIVAFFAAWTTNSTTQMTFTNAISSSFHNYEYYILS